MKILQNLEPKAVFQYFEEISNIPRGSGNEKGISDYLLNFGKELGLESIQDEALNVIIKKPGTPGYENAPTVIIQGHMDMVCEKNNGVEHDFEKDPLKLRIVDDYIYATDTTLGADNGIAVAYAMAILASNDIPHPPIEVLLTTDEETGMSGAMAIKKENLQGKILINLDNEEEGYLLVSCAGGVRSTATLKVDEQEIGSKKLIKINISGLKGGHSGMDIIKERGNSNKILGRVLKGLLREVKFNLVSLNGGSKNNAIPREAEAIIAVNPNDENTAIEVINNWNNIIENELRAQDPGLKIEASITDIKTCKEFTDESTKKVVDLLYIYPNGINSKSTEIEGLVESSTNLGVLTTKDGVVEFDSAIRSSIPSLKEEIVLRSKTIVELLGGKFETTSDYPGWEYDPNSKVRDICQKVHKDMYGKEAKIVAIHAGVECGLFNEKLGNLDMISFGPNLYDVHTPDEHMSISSVKNCYEYLLGILKEIR
ncbi:MULTISPECIES: aminoacyl-histidine dipeptidase [Clostridium]|uniref:aminoacyl-histidine dipeptidase n=1 Tax=Clostridium TaxID=1485 RepID=UPI0006C7318C|nr:MULTISPECIES: aminoacyl-histidine dipeptidase [Clostridium]MBX9183536.1 aminoacyl-histidine dipeptidase [Clostridium sp. K04]MDU7454602.1 aminoacyl-histidine dipeptidase [Clostridium saudiense]MEE0728253.1 aminoacyl-histidine dipeptidase [Clostridium saudiense]CUO92974.1 aminoacyl-histidine dipeptidase [Clostridium disporicum]SCJ79821.1 Cytosol non-specific dipeptidase [uncultured Clostridium sp.]